MRKLLQTLLIACAVFFFSCDTLQNLPTNTTGGLFSLNGSWKLKSTNDGSNLLNTVINVTPVVGTATVKILRNNNYCIGAKDELWNTIKSNNTGGFTLNTLVSACNGTTVFKQATITVVNNDQITVSSTTPTNAELVQTWVRMKE